MTTTDEDVPHDDVSQDDGLQDDGPQDEVSTGRDPVVVAGAALALALLVYVVVLGLGLREDAPDVAAPATGLGAAFGDERAEAAVTTASDQVEGLLTLDPTTVDTQLETLTARTTGDFQRQFEALVQTFATVVREGQVSTQGEINGAGLIELEGDAATVLVASSAAVTNSQTDAPTPRSYRMRVGLQWVDDTWLISGIEFVGGKGQDQ